MKRGAEEYITKEHGATPNKGTGEDTVRMSTAAQQARRKIAQPKSRLGRSTTPTTTSNPFGAVQQPQQQQSFGGFSFSNPSQSQSQSQSFPPPQQSQQINFAPQSSSFTFGSSNEQAVNNPFASLGASTNGMTNGSSNDADVMQESPQKQPSFGGFNASNTNGQSNGTGLGFGFGQPAQSQLNTSSAPPSQPLFGAVQPQSQTNGFSFGAQSTSAPSSFGLSSTTTAAPAFGSQPATTPSSSIFGGLSSNTGTSNTLFGAQSQTSAAPLFGGLGSTSSATPATTSSPAPLFNFPSTSQTSKSEDASKPQTFSFGSTSSFGKSSSGPAPNASASEPAKPFSFGQSAVPASQPETTASPKPAFSFSPAPAASEPPKSSSFQFGQSAASQSPSPAPPTTNLFGSMNKPDTTTSTSLFGSKPTSSEQSQPSSASATSTTPPAEEPAQPSNPFASLFASSKSTSSTAAEAPKPKPIFSFAPSPATASSAAPASNSIFSPAKPAVESTNSSNLFNLNKPTPPPPAAAELTPSKPSSSMFGASLSSAPALTADAGSTPFKPSTQQADKRASQSFGSSDEQPAKKRLFTGTSTPESMAQSAGLQGTAQPPPNPAKSVSVPGPKETINRAVLTEGPPQIPRYLDGNKYKEYDENWRLKALNRRFKSFVTSIDPDKYDYLSVVQNYLDHRAAIGAPVLEDYQRSKLPAAGTKRKATDVDDIEDDADQNKKAKPAAQSFKPTGVNMWVGPPSSTQINFLGAAPKSTTPPSSPPKATAAPSKFVPAFGAGGAKTNFANSFAAAAAASKKKSDEEEREKRKLEDFDSDEDDEESWNKKYEEEQRAKKAKLSALGGKPFGFTPSVSPSRSASPSVFSFAAQPVKSIESDAPPAGESKEAPISLDTDASEDHSGSQDSCQSGESGGEQDEPNEGSEDGDNEEDEEEQGEDIPDLKPEQSLFSRVSKETSKPIMQPAANKTFGQSVMFSNIGQSTPSAPSFSPLTPATSGLKGDFVPSKTFNFTPTPASSSTAFGALKDGPIPGEGLFGSRPSTPQPSSSAEKPANPFAGAFNGKGSFGSSIGGTDNTWKAGSPIKFNGDKDAPSVEVTAATPPAKDQKPLGIFGAATSSAVTNPPISNGTFTGFNFNKSGPSFLSAAGHLTADNTGSGISSRGSSPGLISEAESVATDNTEDYSSEPQTNLNTGAGEENEDTLFEQKAILLQSFKKGQVPEKSKLVEGWNKVGTGNVKLLKDKDTNKCRILFRIDPSGAVRLNTRLVSGVKYTSTQTGKQGAVTFLVPTDKGMDHMMVKVKTKADSDRLATMLEENKKN